MTTHPPGDRAPRIGDESRLAPDANVIGAGAPGKVGRMLPEEATEGRRAPARGYRDDMRRFTPGLTVAEAPR